MNNWSAWEVTKVETIQLGWNKTNEIEHFYLTRLWQTQLNWKAWKLAECEPAQSNTNNIENHNLKMKKWKQKKTSVDIDKRITTLKIFEFPSRKKENLWIGKSFKAETDEAMRL